MSIQSFVRVGPPRLFLLGLGFALSGAVSVVLGQAPDWNGPRGNVPPIGTTHSFCLLVDFPDCPADPALTPAEVARLLNEQGYTGFGQRGSIRDYWQHASGGKFDLVTDLPFGWYRATTGGVTTVATFWSTSSLQPRIRPASTLPPTTQMATSVSGA